MRASDLLGLGDQDLRLADRSKIDESAIERDRTAAFLLRLCHRFQDAPRLGDFGFARGEKLVGERDLAGMDRPFAFAAEDTGAVAAGAIAVRIGEVAERSV